MYEPKYLNLIQAEEARILENEYGFSQSFAERLLLNPAFEDESTYPVLHTILDSINRSKNCKNTEFAKSLHSKMKSNNPVSNKKALKLLGINESDITSELVNVTRMLARVFEF